MTPEQLVEIKKLVEAATPGPYHVASIYPAYGVFRVQVDEPSECVAMCAVSMNEDADEPHVERQEAHARNGTNARAIAALLQHALPLVKALREAWARCDTLRDLADEKAHDAGLYARRMEQAQIAGREARAEVERLRAAIARFVNQYPWQQGPEIQELKALKEEDQ